MGDVQNVSSKPHRHPVTAMFWTREKPCPEALADLSAAYNRMANEVERLWELEEQLETQQRELDLLRQILKEKWPPDWWWHEAHGLHDEAHHQHHDPMHLCVPLNTAAPLPAEASIPATDPLGYIELDEHGMCPHDYAKGLGCHVCDPASDPFSGEPGTSSSAGGSWGNSNQDDAPASRSSNG